MIAKHRFLRLILLPAGCFLFMMGWTIAYFENKKREKKHKIT